MKLLLFFFHISARDTKNQLEWKFIFSKLNINYQYDT